MNPLGRLAGKILYILSSLIPLVSCVPSYVPNTVNAPLFSNKGEIQAAVYDGLSGFDPQVSYAVANHIGLMVNGSFDNRTSDSTDNFHKHSFVEFGGGYFTKFGNDGVLEIYSGFGVGSLEALYESGIFSDYAKVNTTRYFIQPTIGFHNEVFDGGFTPRLSIVTLSQGSESETGVFWEPTLTGKVGYRFLRFVFQFGVSFPINDEQITFGYQPFILSFGIQGIFRRKYDGDPD